MKTYKLGNKVTCIIRSYTSGYIGDQYMQFANQPYTILKDVEGSIRFADTTRNAQTDVNKLAYSVDHMQEITFSNIELNDKILNLIFSKSKENLINLVDDSGYSDENCRLILPSDAETLYNVFIYNVDNKLEKAIGETKEKVIDVEYADKNYLVFYSYPDTVKGLGRDNNLYLTLDLIMEGNADDEPTKTTMHIEKCVLSVDKNMYFNNRIMATDLHFTVINDEEDNVYIGLEKGE